MPATPWQLACRDPGLPAGSMLADAGLPDPGKPAARERPGKLASLLSEGGGHADGPPAAGTWGGSPFPTWTLWTVDEEVRLEGLKEFQK